MRKRRLIMALCIFTGLVLLVAGYFAWPSDTVSKPVWTGSHFEFSVVSKFERGAARIVPGMTKQQVLTEIPKSGLAAFNHRCRLRDPDVAMQKQDVWTLIYGSGGGAAPGTYSLRVTFVDGKVAKLEHRNLMLP